MSPPTDPALPLRLLDVHQVCELIGCARHALRRWVRDGCFPQPLRFSRRYHRWNLDDVLDHLNQLSH